MQNELIGFTNDNKYIESFSISEKGETKATKNRYLLTDDGFRIACFKSFNDYIVCLCYDNCIRTANICN